MSDQDQVKPFHAKEAAPGQEAADVVAEVLKHAAAREEAVKTKLAPKGPPKWMLPLTLNLGVLALYFLIAQPEFLVVSPNVDRRTVAERVSTARNAMFLGISRIESFQIENGRLPETLEEAGSTLAGDGVTYSIQGDSTFLLIGLVDDETIVYDSAVQTSLEFAEGITAQLPG